MMGAFKEGDARTGGLVLFQFTCLQPNADGPKMHLKASRNSGLRSCRVHCRFMGLTRTDSGITCLSARPGVGAASAYTQTCEGED